ncbi:hypothetical protein GRI69_15380 [Erythrobacter vulgaris]|uniref:Uncharacterized protein n=1 Tax=Qipengyuania vulgaris TaxID=291985 RepID=A0A844XXI9_9SPHN|nr:hypothetical protein [Qipengyuania vulgaris]MXO49632.1 hypothetical protein [Qipengyuania vulgaris]
MSNDLLPGDGFHARLQHMLQDRSAKEKLVLPAFYNKHTNLAPTFEIARVDGGVGASMFALLLSHYLKEQPLIIQVGGMKSWAYRELPENHFIHVKPIDEEGDREDVLAASLDRRLRHGERIAIIEYEQALPAEAIGAANFIANQLHGFSMLFLIADKNDVKFKLLETAINLEVERVVGLRKHGLAQRADDRLLQIPAVPSFIAAKLQSQPSSFAFQLKASENPVAAMRFQERLDAFFEEIKRRMQ